MNRNPARRQTGLTLVESLITVAVAAVTLGTALPSFEAARERRHLDGAAAQLETDIQYARGLAVAQNRNMRISFVRDVAGSCYMVHSGSAGDCTCRPDGIAACRGAASAMHTVRFANADALQLNSNVGSIVFDAAKGTSTPTGTLRLQGRGGRSVNLVVNIMGRVRACTPTPPLSGYATC